jgi:hypothetical protein
MVIDRFYHNRRKNFKEFIKSEKKLFFIFTFVFLATFVVSFFVVDVGVNSKFFIRRDFNKAMNYLVAGDCESYKRYFYNGNDNGLCEKKFESVKIQSIIARVITHNFGSDTAFLQAELSVISTKSGKEVAMPFRFKMKKDWFAWKIEEWNSK